MKLNVKPNPIHTHEGAVAQHINPELALRRSVMACMLWEDSFYESGEDIAARIVRLVGEVKPAVAAAVAIEARTKMKLRHVPLLIVRAMARLPLHKSLVAATLAQVIQRPDELTEFLSIYWKDGRQPLSAQVKKGLSKAFSKFNEYALAKYDRDGAVKLRDALFLCHAKPIDATKRYTKLERKAGTAHELSANERLYLAVVNRELQTPDTWEVALSGGADKKEAFERLLAEKKLGALALLRNLRNMSEAGVPKTIVAEALTGMSVERVLPFRFIAAARAVPQWEDIIEPAMLKCAAETTKLSGRTCLLVDVSGSMDSAISSKSDLRRLDAACGLAILLREVAETVNVVTFSDRLVPVPPRRGFALRDAIVGSQPHGGTQLGGALKAIHEIPSAAYDRIIVLTDEQSHDAVGAPKGIGWMVNVAAYQNGVGYGAWRHIDGWSEAVLDYIKASE